MAAMAIMATGATLANNLASMSQERAAMLLKAFLMSCGFRFHKYADFQPSH